MGGKAIGILLAGGVGSRFKGDKPKQYYQIHGREMISYTIEAFRQSESLADFVVVLDEQEFQDGRLAREYGVRTVQGGKTRNHSLKNALDYISVNFPDCAKVIENNAACPMLKPRVVNEIIALLDDYDFVQCTYKITDALGSYKTRLVNREDYFLIQSPDAYRFPLLYKHFDPENPIGHPAVQLPDEAKGYNYFGFQPNFKVTYPEDLRIVELLMERGREAK